MRWFNGGLVGFFLAWPLAAGAQAPACVPTGSPSHDSIVVSYLLGVPENRIKGAGPTDYLLLADAIRAHLVHPVAVDLPDWAHALFRLRYDLGRQNAVQSFDVNGEVDFQLDSLGHLLPATLRVNTGSLLLDGELTNAVQTADSTGELSITPAAFHASKRPIELAVVASADAVPQSIPFALWKTPVEVLETPPSTRLGMFLDYPSLAAANGSQGNVQTQFIVDATGRVEPGSARVLRSNDAEFNRTTIRAIEATTFRPGLSRGCPVRVLVQVNVMYGAGKG